MVLEFWVCMSSCFDLSLWSVIGRPPSRYSSWHCSDWEWRQSGSRKHTRINGQVVIGASEKKENTNHLDVDMGRFDWGGGENSPRWSVLRRAIRQNALFRLNGRWLVDDSRDKSLSLFWQIETDSLTFWFLSSLAMGINSRESNRVDGETMNYPLSGVGEFEPHVARLA